MGIIEQAKELNTTHKELLSAIEALDLTKWEDLRRIQFKVDELRWRVNELSGEVFAQNARLESSDNPF